MSDEEFIDAPLAEIWRFRDDPDKYELQRSGITRVNAPNPVDELVSVMRMSGIAGDQIGPAAVDEARKFCEEPPTEIELLRLIAQFILEAHEQDDLWIDGIHGAAMLTDAHRLAEEWMTRFPLPSE